MGKRKLDIKLVEDKQDRMVKFSKRRQGLFKKAQELSTLCGCDVAIITFSIAGKPFLFGSPDVETVINRYISSTSSSPGTLQMKDAAQQEINGGHSKELEDLEIQKRALEHMRERVLARMKAISTSSFSSSTHSYAPVLSSSMLQPSYECGFCVPPLFDARGLDFTCGFEDRSRFDPSVSAFADGGEFSGCGSDSFLFNDDASYFFNHPLAPLISSPPLIADKHDTEVKDDGFCVPPSCDERGLDFTYGFDKSLDGSLFDPSVCAFAEAGEFSGCGFDSFNHCNENLLDPSVIAIVEEEVRDGGFAELI